MQHSKATIVTVLVFGFLLFQVPTAYSSESDDNAELYEFLSSESAANAKLFDFLSNVVGLDLTKYSVVPPSVVPPGFESLRSYDEEDYIYSEAQPTDTLGRAKVILQQYQTFFQRNYGNNASYLLPMLDILNSVNEVSPTEFTEGNVTFQVSNDGNETRIKWIYTEGDVVMDWKRVDIDFRYGAFESFHDTWGLYIVSGLSEISSEEAFQIAFEAAQNYEFRIVYENGTIKTVKVPDLSNAPYDVNMYMVPFRFDENNFPSKIERDPLTLYPLWQLHFFFNETIGGNEGMQVGVWGDTSEIVYCSGFGYYGNSDPFIPEFSSLAILPSILILVLCAVLIRNKVSKNRKNEKTIN
ncbi:MAG: hypothetical protein P8Y18_00420 [Candidatus Bathyarchaeota archaeon]